MNGSSVPAESRVPEKTADAKQMTPPNGDLESSGKEAAPAAPAPYQMEFPDGGLKAWATVAGAWLVLFTGFGYVNAFGVFQEYYQSSQLADKTSSDIAWIGSVQLFFQFALSSITGKLFDEGYYRYMLAAGSIIYVVGLFMVSLADQYYSIFLAQALAMGIGIGLTFIPAVASVSHHFRRRRALATGIVVSGSSVGGVCFPIMLNNLFEKQGFAQGVRASGYLILGCLAVANCLITTRLPPFKQRPAHMQVRPDIKSIVTDVPYLICNAGIFCVIISIFYPFFYLQVFAADKGVSRTISFYCLSILNAASVFGRVLPNFLADSFGPMNLMIPCIAMSAILIFIMLACGSAAGIVCFAIFFGFFSGAYISLLPSVQVGFARSPFEIGIRMGLPFSVLSIGALVGTPISGQLVGDGPDFHWWKGSVFSGTLLLFGTSLVVVSRMMQAKRKGTQKV